MTDSLVPFDVISLGRVGVDLYPLQIETRLEDVQTFAKFLGGSATNVAVATARLGLRTAVITRTGMDPFGRFVHQALQDYGVDDRYVSFVEGLATPITFCEIFPPDDFPLWFYRSPNAPDLDVRADELDLPAIAATGVLWATATGLSREPSRSAHLAAWGVRRRGQHTILDLDYRPSFWSSEVDARSAVSEALGFVSIAIGNRAECEMATGESDPVRAARALLDAGVEIAVVKLGPGGALAVTADEHVEVPSQGVTVVNGLGAGDGFGGAFCYGLLSGWPLVRTVTFANAAGAIVASRLGCSTAMPTAIEVEAMLEKGSP